MTSQEVELRIALTEAGYRKFVDHLRASLHDELNQWNVFFNAKSGPLVPATIRLRNEKSNLNGSKWFFTVKERGSDKDGVATRPETECPIPESDADVLLRHPEKLLDVVPKVICNVLEPYKCRDFVISGDMTTIRRVIPYEGFHLECDETILPDGSKYFVIEIEDQDCETAKKKVTELMTSLEIEHSFAVTGKLNLLMRLPSEKRFSREFPLK